MMHAAKLEHSDRLKRVLDLLMARGGEGATSWEIMTLARTVAPGTCASELRSQGYMIDCKQEGRTWRYRLLKEGQGELFA